MVVKDSSDASSVIDSGVTCQALIKAKFTAALITEAFRRAEVNRRGGWGVWERRCVTTLNEDLVIVNHPYG